MTKTSLMAIMVAGFVAFVQANAFASQSIVVGTHLEPPHLDPTSAAAGAIDQVLYTNVFEGLTRFAEDGSIIPALASHWEISPDEKTYIFHLQQNVRFHDGTVMDAEDVRFSLNRARADDSTNAQKNLFASISNVEIIDKYQIRITLAEANGQFLFNLAWGDAVIVAPESIATIRTQPIGTGAFVMKRWQKGDRIILERNLDYWGPPALLEQVTFRFIADRSAAFAAIMAGDVDAFPGYPAPETLSQFQDDPRFRIVAGSTEGETILAINNAAPPLNNLKVRQAIAHAIDRKAIIDGVMFGYGTPIGSHFAPHHPDYLDLTASSQHDPEKAKALLGEAGYGDGFDLTLKLPPPSYARRGGELIQAQLAAIGINARIETLEWAQWLEEVFRGKNYDLTIISHTEPFDIGIYGRDDYYFQYANPAFDAVIDALGKTSKPDERRTLAHEAQRIIARDSVNAFLFQLPQISVINANVMGMWKNAPTQAIDMTAVYWQE